MIIFSMWKFCCIFALLLNIHNVYGAKLKEQHVFINKLQQNSYPQPDFYKIAKEQISSNNHNIDGGITEANPNDIKYYELAQESLKKYLEDTGKKQHRVLKVTKATEQVVAGSMTRIDFNAAPIMDDAPILKISGVNVYHNKIITCHSEIWDRPWINVKIIEVDCWE